MRIKKTLVIILTVFIVLSCFTNTAMAKYQIEHKDITVTYNGEYIDCGIQPPVIKNGRTMVPLRAVFERMGCVVNFNSGVITAVRGEETVTLAIGKTDAQVISGGIKKEYILDTVPIIENDKTLVPVRFIAEALGAKTNWNPNQREVVIIDVSEWKKDIKENAPAIDTLLSAPFSNLPDCLFDNHSTLELDFKMPKGDAKTESNIKLKLTFNGQTSFKDGSKKMSYTVNIKSTGLKAYINTVKDKEEKQRLQKLAEITKLNLEFVLDNDYNAYFEADGIKKITDAFGVSKKINDTYLMMPIGKILTEETGLPLGTILRTGSIWNGIDKAVTESNTMFTQTAKSLNDIIYTLKTSLNNSETKLTLNDNDIKKCVLKAESDYKELKTDSGVVQFKWKADISSSKTNNKQSKINLPSKFTDFNKLLND